MTEWLTLPDGFEWLARTGDSIRYYHRESGKHGGIAGVVCRVSSDAKSLQAELDYQIARTLEEARRDRVFAECGGDMDAYRARMVAG